MVQAMMMNTNTHTLAAKVLVVDDCPDQREAISRLLESKGLTVMAAATGLEAIRATFNQRPDVILLDLSMPDMDGIEFLRHVAENGYDGTVVLLSGMESGVLKAAERLAMAQGLTILGACAKPVAAQELGDLVNLARMHRRPRRIA
jgi:CheY-like chemotaxis protein